MGDSDKTVVEEGVVNELSAGGAFCLIQRIVLSDFYMMLKPIF